jgi:Family of unknown function (DUF5996)
VHAISLVSAAVGTDSEAENMSVHSLWPDLPLSAWSETCDTLQLWTQIVGKVRIAITPLINQWWNAMLFVTARGLEAPAMHHAGGTFDVLFDLAGHRLVVQTDDGRVEEFALRPMAVADFYAEFMHQLHRLGIEVLIWTMPCEIENSVPFTQDRIHAQYDREYVSLFHQALVQSARVMNEFRARFIGKASPVHFFWGSFDLAATRFSGRTAPPPKGVTPNVAPWVMAEAYSHEVSSCGFWPGNGGFGYAAFYVYAYPEPVGYDAVRRARDPDALLLGFLQETYAAAADLAKWDRNALEHGNESQDRVDAPRHLGGG